MLPSTPNLVAESDRYFLMIYDKAIDDQNPIVSVESLSFHGFRNESSKIFAYLEERGLGSFINEDTGYTTVTSFRLNDNGVKYGSKLERAKRRRFTRRKFAKHVWPGVSGIAAFIAAIAAVVAAYFSYLGLQLK
jgi:hypothetical protein